MLLGLVLMLAMQAPSIQTIVTDAMSQVESPKQAVARTPAEWTKLWREHAGETDVPKVDFASRTVVAVFLGTRSSAGYFVEITGTRHDKGALVVEWRERRPQPDQVSAQVITSPAHIATIPKFAGEIRFEKVER
jgi:PrcB C-terminal